MRAKIGKCIWIISNVVFTSAINISGEKVIQRVLVVPKNIPLNKFYFLDQINLFSEEV